jgi:hypothetical protein
MDKIILKKDLVIPAGTVFDNCDELTEYWAGNIFLAVQGTEKDSLIEIYIDKGIIEDKPDQFVLSANENENAKFQ